VIEEIGTHSPLYPALVAPESRLPIACAAPGIDFCVREVNGDVFVLACMREGEAARVDFTGLPRAITGGEVMFEAPRKVEAKDGRFSDWFAPFEVHVYRFRY